MLFRSGIGRDVLIGGFGSDRLVGNAADDILVAGTTAFDGNESALCAIVAEWGRADVDFQTRVNHLLVGGGANLLDDGTKVLLNAQTAYDDTSLDVLTGSSGTDWFLFNRDNDGVVKDRVTDMSTFESLIAQDIDFIHA